MSQSNGRDPSNGAGQFARPRMDAYDPRLAAEAPTANGQHPQYAPNGQPLARPAQQAYGRPSAQPAQPPQQPPAPAAPQYRDPNAGYSYPNPAPPPRGQATQPMSAYQYLPQGYGPGGPQQAPAQQPVQPSADPRLSSLGDANRGYRPDPRGEPRFDTGGDPRARTVPQPQDYAQRAPAAFDPGRPLPQQGSPQHGTSAPAPYDPRYQQPAYAPPQPQPDPGRTQPPAPPQATAGLRGGHFDHHAPNDPRGFDLASYMPNGQPGHVPPPGPSLGYPPAPGPTPQDQWRQDASLDRGAPNALAGDQLSYPDDPDPDADYDAAEEPPATRGRGLLMVGLLLVAIGTGGGLAYAYKTFFAGPKSGQTAKVVVKAPAQPSKTLPSDPGGKKIANADSKLLDRVGNDGSASEEPGVTRVKSIPINPNGTVGVPSIVPVESRPPPGAPVVSMPGIMLRDSSVQPLAPQPIAPSIGSGQPTPPRAVQITNGVAGQPPAPPLPQATPLPAAKQRMAVAAPQPPPEAVAAAVAPAPPKAVAKKPPAKAASPDAFAPGGAAPLAATASVAAPRGASAGYLAALSSSTSEAAALQSLADLQQSYGTVLGNKMMNVVRAEIPGKGVFFRVVVGPAASKQAANKVCSDVTAAGHAKGECWPVEDTGQ